MSRPLLVVFVALLLAGCGGSSSEAGELFAPTTVPTTTIPTTVPVTTTAVPPSPPTPPAVRGAVPPGSAAPVVQSGPTDRAEVALTFDADLTPGMRQKLRDGRVESYANVAVLDILQATGTPATIFLTGLWMEEYPALTSAIAADPRLELATHSQTHRAFRPDCYGLPFVPAAEMVEEIRTPLATLARFTDRATRYFRFPGLCHDDLSLAAAAQAGVTVVDGEASGDAGGTSAEAVVRQTLRAARAGSIIVMHLNGGDTAPYTDDALPRIIEGLHAKGLTPTTLSDLLS